jgi:NAD(P)-dependent dehydrogenase (short-subunit alcohol dehydrogenase family)
MSMRLKDRVAIITGAASGMGQATALRFLDEGASVVVADFNEQNGQATLKLAGDAGHANKPASFEPMSPKKPM